MNFSAQPNTWLPADELAVVLNALPAAVYLTDKDGSVTYHNQAAAELWGCRPETGTQRWLGAGTLFAFDGTELPHDESPMAIALQTGQPVRGVELVVERADGTRVPCAVYASPLTGSDGTVVGWINMLVDISHRKAEEAKAAVLARELRHRVNNTLAMVQAIMGSTLRLATTMDEFQQNFTGRIAALAKTHAMLTEGVQSNVLLRDLLNNELQMFTDGDESGVRLSGPDVVLSERVAVPVGMAVHELATNAAKYGALSVVGGRLVVAWTLADEVAHLEWKETNVPMPVQIRRIGFGTRLLRDVLPRQIGARIDIQREPDGVTACMTFPVR